MEGQEIAPKLLSNGGYLLFPVPPKCKYREASLFCQDPWTKTSRGVDKGCRGLLGWFTLQTPGGTDGAFRLLTQAHTRPPP